MIAADAKPTEDDFAIGPQVPAEPKMILAEDFSILVCRRSRFRRDGDRFVLLH